MIGFASLLPHQIQEDLDKLDKEDPKVVRALELEEEAKKLTSDDESQEAFGAFEVAADAFEELGAGIYAAYLRALSPAILRPAMAHEPIDLTWMLSWLQDSVEGPVNLVPRIEENKIRLGPRPRPRS